MSCKKVNTLFSVFWPPDGLDVSQTEASEGLEDTKWCCAVVLENVPEDINQEYLSLLVGSIGNHSEDEYSLELIPESSTAVSTFNDPSGMSLTCSVT